MLCLLRPAPAPIVVVMSLQSPSSQTTPRIARGFSGGLSVLVAVALAVAVGTGTETARRVATTGAGLVSSLVCDRTVGVSVAELAAGQTARRNAFIAALVRIPTPRDIARQGMPLRPELLDLPPPVA